MDTGTARRGLAALLTRAGRSCQSVHRLVAHWALTEPPDRFKLRRRKGLRADMFERLYPWAVACVLACAPLGATPQPGYLALVTLPTAPPDLSPDCRASRGLQERAHWPFLAIRRAVRSKSSIKVLAIGSSSTAGVGASSPSATFVSRLETSLESAVRGLEFDVVGRGRSGEVAEGAADRMRQEVAETEPDLVVWQVGTNDALRHVSLDKFKRCLRATLAWLAERRIDVVLLDPQYGDALTKDGYYQEMVDATVEVAREARVLLVDRFEAMRELQRERGDSFYLTSDKLHMNDRGHRCVAEQLARVIVGGLLQADADAAPAVVHD